MDGYSQAEAITLLYMSGVSSPNGSHFLAFSFWDFSLSVFDPEILQTWRKEYLARVCKVERPDSNDNPQDEH